MEFNVQGKKLNITDALIEEYLRRTSNNNDTLIMAVDLHCRRAMKHPDVFGTDLNIAVENSIKDELELWE